MPLHPQVARLVTLALEEDIGPGDVTSESVLPADRRGAGRIVAREPLVVSGLEVATAVFGAVEPAIVVTAHAADGDRVEAGATLLEVSGPARGLLTAERTALNFLQRLSGIATLTRRYVDALGDGKTRLLDTRKTTPGWRLLEKAAVRHGGGVNHRTALFDGVLIKDNHILAAGGIAEAITRARAHAPHLVKIEVEVESLAEARAAVEAGADMLLLDNMDDAALTEVVGALAGQALLEASGGITLERLPAIARTGVDFVSCGAVTHSATAVDIALDLTV